MMQDVTLGRRFDPAESTARRGHGVSLPKILTPAKSNSLFLFEQSLSLACASAESALERL
jgi:hypothetical protein